MIFKKLITVSIFFILKVSNLFRWMMLLFQHYHILSIVLFHITLTQCEFYQQAKTQVNTTSILHILPNVTVTECVTSCLQSATCGKSALKEDGTCLHLKDEKEKDHHNADDHDEDDKNVDNNSIKVVDATVFEPSKF